MSQYTRIASLSILAILSSSICQATPSRQIVPIPQLFRRTQPTCNEGYNQCPTINFCCPTSTTCIPLANGTAVACCGVGEDCRIVQPLSCQSNAASNGEQCSTGKAAGQCCPTGYVCAGDYCQMPFEDWPQNQNVTPTTAPTEGVMPTATGLVSLANLTADGYIMKQDCPAFPAAAVASGFFPGLVIGALLVYAITFCWERRKRNQNSTFKRMPEMEVTSTQNVYAHHQRFNSAGSGKPAPNMVMIGYNKNNNTDKKIPPHEQDAEAERRGGAHVHGETPQLPSVHTFHPQDHSIISNHSRKTSNPSFRDIKNRYPFHMHPSEDNLNEDSREHKTLSGSTETSFGSSHHSSVTNRGRFPVSVPKHHQQQRPLQQQQHENLHISIPFSYEETNHSGSGSSNNTTITAIDDITPSTGRRSSFTTVTYMPEAPEPPKLHYQTYRAGRLSSPDDDKSIACESMYPSSFLDMHFQTPATPTANYHVPNPFLATPQPPVPAIPYTPSNYPASPYSYTASPNIPPLPPIAPLFSSPTRMSPDEDIISPIGNSLARIGMSGRTDSASTNHSAGSYEMVIPVGMEVISPTHERKMSVGTTGTGATGRTGVPLRQATMNAGRYTMQTMELNRI